MKNPPVSVRRDRRKDVTSIPFVYLGVPIASPDSAAALNPPFVGSSVAHGCGSDVTLEEEEATWRN
jgi:hypothetical protein